MGITIGIQVPKAYQYSKKAQIFNQIPTRHKKYNLQKCRKILFYGVIIKYQIYF